MISLARNLHVAAPESRAVGRKDETHIQYDSEHIIINHIVPRRHSIRYDERQKNEPPRALQLAALESLRTPSIHGGGRDAPLESTQFAFTPG